MPALIKWIDVLGHEEADKVTERSELDCTMETIQQKLDPRFLVPGLSMLMSQVVLRHIIYTITPYLDSQQTWLYLAKHGLHTLLVHVGTSMWVTAQQYTQQTMKHAVMISWYFDFLTTAGDFYFTHS